MVEITKYLNLLEIRPLAQVGYILEPILTYQRVLPTYGAGRRRVDRITETLYQEQDGALVTFAGLLDRITAELDSYRIPYRVQERGAIQYPQPVWQNLQGVRLRDAQIRMLGVMTTYDRAQLNGCTGLGKSFLIVQYTKLYPYQDFGIVICAQQLPVVRSLYRQLLDLYGPEVVGMVGGGRRDLRRITVATTKSLLKAPVDDCRVLIYDEVHTAAASSTAAALIKYKKCRMFGLSASTEVRTDKADMLVEALFGPVRIHIPYAEAQQQGYVARVKAYFYKVQMPPCGSDIKIVRKRKLVWRNSVWNQALVRITQHWLSMKPDAQILIMTDAIEHVLRISRLLPDFRIMYANIHKDQLSRFVRQGLLPDDYRPLTKQQQAVIQSEFEEGKIRRLISTTTMGTGVDMRNLDVFIRADGGSSEISNIQFRGRLARGSEGVYCDIWAEGDETELNKSRKRRRSCVRDGWDVEVLELP